MGDRLFNVLSPLADAASWDARELLDRLEMFVALGAVDAHDELAAEGASIPASRFCWAANMERDHPAATLLEEAEQHGTDWAPQRDGFLEGGVTGFGTVHASCE